MADLEMLSEIGPGRFRIALKTLTDMAYVTGQGPTLEETVQLTDKGEGVDGTSKLVSRYKDAPATALRSAPAC
jgi:hypothetical protein